MKVPRIEFEPLRETDLPLLHRWLNTPHVSRWWKIDGVRLPSFELVRQHYLRHINGERPAACFVIKCDGHPAGMIETYLLDNFPDEKESLDLSESYAGLDILIGEENYLHRGLGSRILSKFLKEVVFTRFDVNSCIIDPEPENKIAIRAYEKTGFRFLKTVWDTKEAGYVRIMVIDRDALYSQEKRPR